MPASSKLLTNDHDLLVGLAGLHRLPSLKRAQALGGRVPVPCQRLSSSKCLPQVRRRLSDRVAVSKAGQVDEACSSAGASVRKQSMLCSVRSSCLTAHLSIIYNERNMAQRIAQYMLCWQ
jgi:hypothetical protein